MTSSSVRRLRSAMKPSEHHLVRRVRRTDVSVRLSMTNVGGREVLWVEMCSVIMAVSWVEWSEVGSNPASPARVPVTTWHALVLSECIEPCVS